MPGIKDLRFHGLRHTGITMLLWRGLYSLGVETP